MSSYEVFYEGNPSSLDAEYGDIFTGYRAKFSTLGGSTSVQTANQLGEVSSLLNQGMKAVEVSTINEEVLEMVPDEHLKEIRKLANLTGSEITLHAPLTDPSGFTQQGWAESEREEAELKLKKVLERAHLLNPTGNIPVTMHSSMTPPGSESVPEFKDGKEGEVQRRMIAVERESGRVVPLQREEVFHPGSLNKKGEGRLFTTEDRLNSMNRTEWLEKLDNMTFSKVKGDELIQQNAPLLNVVFQELQKAKTEKEVEEIFKSMSSPQREVFEKYKAGTRYIEDAYQKINSYFNKAYRDADEEQKKYLLKLSEQFKESLPKTSDGKRIISFNMLSANQWSKSINNLMDGMHELVNENPIKSYIPVEQFVKEKASKTVSNAALHSWQKFGESSPIISIENPPYGSAVSRGKELKELVEEARKKFVEEAVKQGIMSKQKAEEAAKKVIGVTWDTSHISMLRKQGFSEKQLIEEAKQVAGMVKHVHFNDNLGTTHTDLPPGMGSVPIKEVMHELEKKGFKGLKIFEGGNFVQHFKVSPFPYLLEGVGPAMQGTIAPYWNQLSGIQGAYSTGFGTYLPDQHFNMYGSGFSGLPQELGGQISNRQSRFSGTPNQ